MNSDDNKDSKPTSSDEISANPIEDGKEKNELEQEGDNDRRNSKYSEAQNAESASQDEVSSKCRKMTTPPNHSGQTSIAEATDQASGTNLRTTPTYEQLLLAIWELHGEIEARKGWEKRRKDDDCSDDDPEDLV